MWVRAAVAAGLAAVLAACGGAEHSSTSPRSRPVDQATHQPTVPARSALHFGTGSELYVIIRPACSGAVAPTPARLFRTARGL